MYCNHCLPCPVGIDIATATLAADWASGGVNDELRSLYASLSTKPSECIACGDCVERCPFGVDGLANMERAAALFE